MKNQFYYVLCIVCFAIVPINAQEISQDDYRRAVSFMYDNYNNKTAFNLYTSVNWFKDGSGLWFVDYSETGKLYKSVDFKKHKAKLLFDHDKLASALSELLNKTIKSTALSISSIEPTENGNYTIVVDDKTYALAINTYTLLEIEEEKKEDENTFESKSPDGKWIAYTNNYNLYIKSTTTNEAHQLSFDGEKDYEYATYYGWYDIMEGENGERPKHFYVDWSEDSKWISTSVVDFRHAEKMFLLDHSIDSLYKSKLLSYYRGSPGDTTMVHVQPIFYNVDSKKEIKTNLPKATHINSVGTRWSEQSGIVFARYPERGYQKEYVKQVDLNSNTEKTLITETSQTNIDNFNYWTLEDHNKIVFLSERSGWRQMYMLDLITNEIQTLTSGNFYINDIEYIDKKSGMIYFLASGKETGNNPYHQQLYKVSLKGKLTLLTKKNTHHIVSFSKNGTYFVDNYSTISEPTKTVLRQSKSGKILVQLTSANVSEAISNGWTAPEIFQLTAKDEKTTIYGAFWKPTNFDPTNSYPIIDATYTGPHTQRFPKSFNRGFDNQSLAELGFIVVQVDGLGTSGRSKAFHDYSYKNMGNNLEDHVLAIKHLGEKYNWINTDKVGIFGHSAGGFDTGHALLAFPDFYKVGVSSSADHDFRMEKAWWPEMYMGWPVDESYHEVSNITMAENLEGKLLLVHGGIDDNVNPSATFKLAEALVNADKEFDLLILPSQRHGYQGKHRSYFIKKRWNYFVEHLLEKKPIWNFKWN